MNLERIFFFSATKYKSIRSVLAVANQLDLEMHKLDVNHIFLYIDLTKDVRKTNRFVDEKFPNNVCNLRRNCQV